MADDKIHFLFSNTFPYKGKVGMDFIKSPLTPSATNFATFAYHCESAAIFGGLVGQMLL